MSKPESSLYEFGEFQLDAARRLLLRQGASVTIAPKVYEVLLALVETPGQPLSKDELLSRVWPDTVVEESNLTVSVSALRKVLGERRDAHQFIATLPGVGYQFVAPVTVVKEAVVNPADVPQPAALEIERQIIAQVVIEEETEADVRARIAASHRHGPVRMRLHLHGELARATAGQVDSRLAHDLDNFGMHVAGG